MNKDVYNLSDIYIFELYETKYDDEYYDDSIELYIKNVYFSLKRYCIGYMNEQEKIIDVVTNQELNIFSTNISNNQEFIFYDIYRKLNYYVVGGAKGIDISRKVLLDLWNIINKDLCLENKYKFNNLLSISIPNTNKGYYPLKSTMYYGNDFDNYYDEYEEYKKIRLQLPRGNNKNILM